MKGLGHRRAIGGDMQIAISHMTKKYRLMPGPPLRQCCATVLGESANFRQWQAHIKINWWMHMNRKLGSCLAYFPQGTRLLLRLCNHHINDFSSRHCTGENWFECRLKRLSATAIDRQQHGHGVNF